MEEACSSTVQAHDVDSARQMIQQHQDLKKRTSTYLSFLSFCLFLCLSHCLSVYVCRMCLSLSPFLCLGLRVLYQSDIQLHTTQSVIVYVCYYACLSVRVSVPMYSHRPFTSIQTKHLLIKLIQRNLCVPLSTCLRVCLHICLIAVFRQRLKTFLFSRSYPDIVT